MTNYLRHFAAGLLTTFATAGAAYAGPVTGSDSIIVFSVGTNPSTDLLSSLAAGGKITFGTIFWAGGAGNLSTIPLGTAIKNTSLVLTNPGLAAFTFTSVDGSFAGAASVTVGSRRYSPEFTGSSGSVAGGSETISLYLVGSFTPAGVIAGFAPDSMSIALTLNENGITGTTAANLGSFSASFTVASPAAVQPVTAPAPSVPEPMSGVLFATAIVALAAVKHRRGPLGRNHRARPSRR